MPEAQTDKVVPIQSSKTVRHSVLDPCPEGEDPSTYMLEPKPAKTGMSLFSRLTVRDYLWAFLLLLMICGYADIKHSLNVLSEEMPSSYSPEVSNEDLQQNVQGVQEQLNRMEQTLSWVSTMISAESRPVFFNR